MRRIILILILLGLVSGAVWYFGFRKNSSAPKDPTSSGFKNFFPIGGGKGSSDTTGQVVVDDAPKSAVATSPFKQLTRNPVAGYTIFSRTKEVTNTSTGTNTVVANKKSSSEPNVPSEFSDYVCERYLHSYISLGGKNNTEDVKKVQEFLNTKEGEKLTVDGAFDQPDSEAIKRFQLKYKDQILSPFGATSPSGSVDKATAAKINLVVCAQGSSCPYFKEYLKQGDSGLGVVKLQDFLNVLNSPIVGYPNNGLQLDKQFDQKTFEVVKSFQETYKAAVLRPWKLKNATGNFYRTSIIAANGFMGCEDQPAASKPRVGVAKQTTALEGVLRYVSRQSGFVYEIVDNETPLQISNTFIPSIYEAYFADDNNTAILRFLRDDNNTIGSYSVPIPPENPDGTRTQKDGVFLPDSISSLAISPGLQEVARLTIEQSQGVINTTSSFDKNKKELLRSPLKEWFISWPQTNIIYAQTKPAGIVPGFLYKIDTTEKRLRKILGDINGLTASVSPSGGLVLYSESVPGGFVAKILNTKTGDIKNTNLAILPEKCVWLKNEDLICAGNSSVEPATYPDTWYAGLVSFSDQVFRIYTANNLFDVVYENNGGSFDMTNLKIDESRNILFFIDKKTGLLWQFSL